MGTITASRMEAPSTGNDIEERKIATNKEMKKTRRWMWEAESETCIVRLMALFTLRLNYPFIFSPIWTDGLIGGGGVYEVGRMDTGACNTHARRDPSGALAQGLFFSRTSRIIVIP